MTLYFIFQFSPFTLNVRLYENIHLNHHLCSELHFFLKVGSKNTTSTPSTLSSVEPSWQMMWHGLQVKVLSPKHRPSHRYLDVRQEYRTFKSVAPYPCDWLLFSLTYEGMRSFINKNRW